VSPMLRRQSIRVPKLLDAGLDPVSWLVLEALPETLPRARWLGDPDTIAYLAQWHSQGTELMRGFPYGFRFHWDEALMDNAVTTLESDVATRLHQISRQFSDEFEELFQPVVWIHGDPNPSNWLIDSQGQVVLTDWARVGHGHPAIDLAILMAGMPDRGRVVKVVRRYREFHAMPSASESHLVTLVTLAKLWSFVDFIAMSNRGELSQDGSESLGWLKKELRPWVAQIFEI